MFVISVAAPAATSCAVDGLRATSSGTLGSAHVHAVVAATSVGCQCASVSGRRRTARATEANWGAAEDVEEWLQEGQEGGQEGDGLLELQEELQEGRLLAEER